MQHGMPRTIGCSASTLRDSLTVLGGHPAKRALIDASIRGARKRHAVVLKFDDCSRRLLAHEFDGVLITEPIRALDGVVKVIPPVVITHITECRGYPALRGHSVTTRREYFGDTGGRQTRLG